MNRKSMLMGCLALVIMLPLAGCQSHYATNRLADFGDIWQVGAGVTAENPVTGPVPPSLGIHVQASEFINLGAVTFHGLTAEVDGRGLFAGPESRTRFGFGPWQYVQIGQDYEHGSANYFKQANGLWTKRMNTKAMRWWHKPAKELDYDFWSHHFHEGFPVMPRGWQYWENFNVEASISEPFVTHLGFNIKLGFDLSEVFDFLLGFTTLDFKHDDLTDEEFEEMQEGVSREVVSTSNDSKSQVTEAVPSDNNDGSRISALRPAPYMDIIYFDFDKSDLRPDQVPHADKNAQYMLDHPDVKILIEGNCDERGTIEYNFSLGERRAATVMNYIIGKGVAPARLRMTSKGEESPVDTSHTEDAWAKNRRDEFKEWD